MKMLFHANNLTAFSSSIKIAKEIHPALILHPTRVPEKVGINQKRRQPKMTFL
jgi:hypothetical protein